MSLFVFNNQQKLIKSIPNRDLISVVQDQAINVSDTLFVELSADIWSNLKEPASYLAVQDPYERFSYHMYKVSKHTTKSDTVDIEAVQIGYDELKAYGYIKDRRFNNRPVLEAATAIVDGTDWQLGYVDTDLPNVNTNFYYISRLEALSKLIEATGAEVRFRVEISGNKIIAKRLDLYKQLGTFKGKRFAYGSNLLEIIKEEDTSELYTALVGRGKGEETDTGGFGRRITFADIAWSKASGKPVDKPLGQEFIELPEMTAYYGYPDGEPRTGIVEFSDIEEPELLLKATYERLIETSRPQVQFKAKVQTTGDMQLGEEVAIIRSDLGFRYKTRVFRVKRDYLNNMFTEVELGDKLTESLASRIKKIDVTNARREEIIIQYIRDAANGKNKIFRGEIEPTEGMMVNDLWYKPIGDGEMEMHQWNGAIWELILSTLDTTKVQREVEAAIAQAEEAKQEAEQSYTDSVAEAERLVQVQTEAFNAQMSDVNDEISTVKTNIETDLTNVNQTISNNFTSLSDSISDVDDIANQAKVDADTALSQANTALSNASAALSDASSAKDKAINSTVLHWALSSSGTTPPTSGWSTTIPTPSSTQFTWGRTTITLNDGTTIPSYNVSKIGVKGDPGSQGPQGVKGDPGSQGPAGSSGADAPKITAVKQQFYLSTSNTTQSGGSWTDTIPVWSTSKYYWTRVVTTYNNSTTTQSLPVLDNALNQSLVSALEAKSATQTLSTTVSQHATQIAAKANQTTVDTLAGRVSTAEGSISVQAGEIALKANQTSVDTLSGKVSTAETNISANTTAINLRATKTEVNTAINGIEVGGRNLLLNSDFSNGLSNWVGQQGGGTVDSSGTLLISNGSSIYQGVDVEEGGQATASIKSKGTGSIRARWGGSNSSYQQVSKAYKTYVFNVPRDGNQNLIIEAGTDSEIMVERVKLEKGNKATDWSPAPEDVDASIAAVQSNLTVEAGKITALTTRVSGTETNISNVTQTVSGINTTISTLRTDVDGKATIVALNSVKSTADGNKTTISNHAGRLTTVETNVSGLQTTVSNKADKTQITQLSDAIVLKADKTALSSKKDAYTTSITINGNGSTYYPLYFILGNQSIPRVIRITRMYGDPAPGSIWNPSQPTHPGGLNMEWVGNFGGWGGASYKEAITSFGEVYTTMLADLGIEHSAQSYAFYLRGGGAKYTISSDQPLNLKVGYSTNDVIFGTNKSSAPKTSVNRSRIDGLITAQNSQISVLSGQISLRVTKDSLMSEINVQAGRTVISTGKLYLDTGSTIMTTAYVNDLNAKTLTAITANITSIRSQVLVADSVTSTHVKADNAMIDNLFGTTALITRLTSKTAFIDNIKAITISADKVTTGTLNAANVNIINLNASSIVGLNSNFVTSLWNTGAAGSVTISASGVVTQVGDLATSLNAGHLYTIDGTKTGRVDANGMQIADSTNGQITRLHSDGLDFDWYSVKRVIEQNSEGLTIRPLTGTGNRLNSSLHITTGAGADKVAYIDFNNPTSGYGARMILQGMDVGIRHPEGGVVQIASYANDGRAGNLRAGTFQTSTYDGRGLRIVESHINTLADNQTIFIMPSGTGELRIGAGGSNPTLWPVRASRFVEGSSRASKTNINPYTGSAIDEIKNLQAVTFNRKEDVANGINYMSLGFIAEDSPSIAIKHPGAPLGVDHYKMVTLAIKGVQELTSITDRHASDMLRVDTYVTQHELEIKILKDRIKQLEENLA